MYEYENQSYFENQFSLRQYSYQQFYQNNCFIISTMSVYHENLYHAINHKTYMTAQMNFIKNEKNIYHNTSNQLSIEKIM